MEPKKGNWIVKARCVVIKAIYCEGCTEEEAMCSPYDYSNDEHEMDQTDCEVLSIEEND